MTSKKIFYMIMKPLKFFYKLNPFYRINQKRVRLRDLGFQRLREEREAKLMLDIFQNQYVVQNGPFKNLKYIKQSLGSAFMPKILGSYEEPIQEWIEKFTTKKKYEQIIDIGCAEGYYACGFAMKLPDVTVLAYDIDEHARINTGKLAKLNNLFNVEIHSECNHEELNYRLNKKSLVFCDIEGYEDYLLNPTNVPNLNQSDMLIETHDFLIPGITDRLVERFLRTHKIQIAVDYPFRIKDYFTPREINDEQLGEITDELRPKGMKWIYLESIYGQN